MGEIKFALFVSSVVLLFVAYAVVRVYEGRSRGLTVPDQHQISEEVRVLCIAEFGSAGAFEDVAP